MKIALLFPSDSNSLKDIFENALIKLKHTVINIDTTYKNNKKGFIGKIDRQIQRTFPKYNYIRNEKTKNEINKKLLNSITSISPDIVISYNDNNIDISTVNTIKKISKFILFLADNPFYSFNKTGFLELSIAADFCVTPDSAVVDQLKMVGVKNILYSNIGYDPNVFYKVNIKDTLKEKYSNDVFYLGNTHFIDSWAYKRPLMLSYLTSFDLKVMGNESWKRVLPKFPELEKKFIYLKKPISNKELNLYMNYSKIYPIDHHPGIINGIHTRVFDAIAGNILPIVEYRKDVLDTFDKVKIPTFKTFSELADKTKYYLDNPKEREKKLRELQEFIELRYRADKMIEKILLKIIY